MLKFIYSEKATKFGEVSTFLSTVHTDKNKVEISKNFEAFSEYMNIILTLDLREIIYIQYFMLLQTSDFRLLTFVCLDAYLKLGWRNVFRNGRNFIL